MRRGEPGWSRAWSGERQAFQHLWKIAVDKGRKKGESVGNSPKEPAEAGGRLDENVCCPQEGALREAWGQVCTAGVRVPSHSRKLPRPPEP